MITNCMDDVYSIYIIIYVLASMYVCLYRCMGDNANANENNFIKHIDSL